SFWRARTTACRPMFQPTQATSRLHKMKLLYTPFSPFARKVRIAALELGLKLELEDVNPWDTHSSLSSHNPALRVPVLCDGAIELPGSTLICEYLDTLHDQPLLTPQSGQERW